MLPKEEWLDRAKRLAIGMSYRVRHKQERRHNLVIGNDHDKWWCYCQACKEGGVVQKDHVRLDLTSPERTRSILTLPIDMTPAIPDSVYRFLASKGMDVKYLGSLLYSQSRKRLLLQEDGGWFGRDVTGDAMEKWLTYNGTQYVGKVTPGSTCVITEDLFSMYKVRWALREQTEYCTLCALGTGIKDSLVRALLNADRVVWMLDGDTAGYKGASEGAHRMEALGVPSVARCAPDGLDPKDMEINSIISHLKETVWHA